MKFPTYSLHFYFYQYFNTLRALKKAERMGTRALGGHKSKAITTNKPQLSRSLRKSIIKSIAMNYWMRKQKTSTSVAEICRLFQKIHTTITITMERLPMKNSKSLRADDFSLPINYFVLYNFKSVIITLRCSYAGNNVYQSIHALRTKQSWTKAYISCNGVGLY